MRKNLQDIDPADDFAMARAARFDIYGTPQNDDIRGAASNENFFVFQGGSDRILGLDGDDRFYFGEAFDATDRANGGEGTDSLVLEGVARSHRYDDLVIGPNMIRDVERIWLQGSGASFDITLKDGFDDLRVATTLFPTSVFLDGSAVKTGTLNLDGSSYSDIFIGGALDDRIVGRGGADTLTGGDGNDRFVYADRSDSSPFLFGIDTITDFSKGDILKLPDLASGYQIGSTVDRVGDVVLSFHNDTNLTAITIYLDNDNVADMSIFMAGDHVDLAIRHGASLVIA